MAASMVRFCLRQFEVLTLFIVWFYLRPFWAFLLRPSGLNCKNEYLELALGEETAVQAVVGSIIWEYRRLFNAKVSGDERPRLRAS